MPEYRIVQAAIHPQVAEDGAEAPYHEALPSQGAAWTHESVPPRWVAGVAGAPITPAPRNAFANRALDIVVALVVLLLTLPFYPIILLAIRLDSTGPALFRQVRAGRNGRPFVVYKFRSMYYSAQANDPLYQQIASSWLGGVPLTESFRGVAPRNGNNGKHTDSLPMRDVSSSSSASAPRAAIKYKLKDDPRITRVGRFLRMTSIDELPQFLNVLRGEMSVVGPRPAIPYEVDRYSPHDFGRLLVKPGVTGLWQVKGRGHVSFQRMIELDLDYVASNSFWYDIALILRTVPAVLFARGAA